MAIAKYSKVCSANTPGNSKFWVVEAANVSGVTVTSGEISSAISMASGKLFFQFQADTDSIQFTTEGKGKGSFAETFKLTAKFSKKTKELIAAKQSLVDAVVCGVIVIRQDANGQCFLSGWNDVDKGGRPYTGITVNFDSGVVPTDEGMNAYTITLDGTNGYDELPFKSDINATIISGTAAFISWV